MSRRDDDSPKPVTGEVLPPTDHGFVPRSPRGLDPIHKTRRELERLGDRSRGFFGRLSLKEDQEFFSQLARTVDAFSDASRAKISALDAISDLLRAQDRLSPDNRAVIQATERLKIDTEYSEAEVRYWEAQERIQAVQRRMQEPEPVAARAEAKPKKQTAAERTAELDQAISDKQAEIDAKSAEFNQLRDDPNTPEAALKSREKIILRLMQELDALLAKRSRV